MAQVTTAEAKRRFSELLQRAHDGERILVTRYGEVVAEIGPPKQPAPSLEEFRRSEGAVKGSALDELLAMRAEDAA